MPTERPTTVDEYLAVAPEAGQSHLHRLREILRSVAPDAEELLKWNTPFFVEPRFLFAFSAHKAHLNFTPNTEGLEPFRSELEGYQTTQGSLQVRYADPLPEDLIRRMAEHRVKAVAERKDDSFW